MLDKSSEYLSTLERGLTVLKSFSRERRSMSLSQVADAAELSPAVVRRCLITLEHLGYVTKVENRFSLAPGVLSLASLFAETYDLDSTVRPVLQRLREETGDSASFTVLDAGDILYLSHVSTQRSIRLQATTGTRYPALLTSTGRSILASLTDYELRQFIQDHPVEAHTEHTVTDSDQLFDKVKGAASRGYAMISDELDYGITSLAAPVVVPGRGVVGAVNSSAQTQRVDINTFADERRDAVIGAA